MNGYERTIAFVHGKKTNRPPFMPLVIDWAAKQMGVDYRSFVDDPALRADTYLRAAERFDIDCILPDADFHEQLADFGMELAFENGHYVGKPFIADLESDIKGLALPEMKPGTRMGNRLQALKQVAAKAKGERYIFGICVGPFTEFCNARGLEDAMMDLLDEEELAKEYVQLFFENGLRFIEAQLAAGADGIQIVEPCCSLIGIDLYRELVQPLHTRLVEAVQKDGGFARLHICGDTNRMLPYTLGTGTRILDVDHAVDMKAAAALLAPGQVLCGNLDPAGVVLGGTAEEITKAVLQVRRDTGERAIISGGCDIPEDTSAENMQAFHDACEMPL